jgi:hypothetical protein
MDGQRYGIGAIQGDLGPLALTSAFLRCLLRHDQSYRRESRRRQYLMPWG